MRRLLLCLAAVLSAPTFAADATTTTHAHERQLVSMPAAARATLRAEMLDFLFALDRITAALAAGKHDEAANIAVQAMGQGSMARHRSLPPEARPGMHMPPEMHHIAHGLHAAAGEFAQAARTGDTSWALSALQGVTGACVACHQTYRIQ